MLAIGRISGATKGRKQASEKEVKLEFMKWKLNRLALVVVIFMALFMVSIVPSQAAAVESDLAGKLPKYPANGQTYWIAFKEGYRNSRIELSTCHISGNKGKAYIQWNRSLTLQGADTSERYNQYKLSEKGRWEQIGTYHRFSDYATSIIASNLDVYDSQGKLLMKKTKSYSQIRGRKDINKAKVAAISKQSYTGKEIKPRPRITFNGKYLYQGVDYTLSYKNNKQVGNASIVIKGKRAYKGTKSINFKIVKKPKGSIKLSQSSLTLSLADVRTHTLKATKNKISSKVKWKSSNTSVAAVKNGKVTAKGVGTTKITVSAGAAKAVCKVTVKDTAEKTVCLSFKTFDEWTRQIRKKEMELVFGGTLGVNTDGSTYYTGNIIVKRQICSYKKVAIKISFNTPGYYKTIYLNLPDKVKYTLHRHNLKNDCKSDSVGRIIVGIMEQQVVWTQKCSCGYQNVIKWDIPIQESEKLKDGETYNVQTNSLVI